MQGQEKYLEERFKHLDEKIDSRDTAIESKLDRILVQTTKHNGRLTKLELRQARIDGASLVIKGLWGMSGLSLLLIIGSIAWGYGQLQAIPTEQEWERMIEDKAVTFLENAELEVYYEE